MNYQPTLFDAVESARLRDCGMRVAVDNADRKIPSWSEDTYVSFKLWLNGWPVGYKFQI